MSRKTIIFGNGLGMALDNEYFSLDKAIEKVWSDESLLDNQSKNFICACLPDESKDRPHKENDLDTLQRVLLACNFLNGIHTSQGHWLSDEGKRFPEAIQKFIYQTAMYFHDSKKEIPKSFIDPLIRFVVKTKSHVATLNYDNLLYGPFAQFYDHETKQEIFRGYSGILVDGFWDSGFASDHLERRLGRNFGYYLHLHGSPLFIERDAKIIKLKQHTLLKQKTDTVSSHIVLTHSIHKTTIITASEVLMSYWNKLAEVLGESDELILMGYSGDDEHLNQLIKNYAASKILIRIIEWDNARKSGTKKKYWEEKMGTQKICHVPLTNILEFDDWD